MRKLCYTLCVLFISVLQAQEQFLFKNDSYSGINGTLNEPTHFLENPNSWDVNLVNMDVFLQNNYAYIGKQNLIGLANATVTLVDRDKGITGDTKNVLDFNSKNSYYANVSTDILGPSFGFKFKIKEKIYAVGLTTRSRVMSSIYNVGNSYDYNTVYNYVNYFTNNPTAIIPQQYTLSPIKTSALNVAEIGLNLATDLIDNGDAKLSAGANLKYEIGLDGGYVNSKDPINLTADRDSIYVHNYNIDAAYATSYNFTKKKYSPRSRGKGYVIDLGITYTEKADKSFENSEYSYAFKTSLSILDLGYVKFSGATHTLNGQVLSFGQKEKLKKFTTIDNLIKDFSYRAYNDSLASYTGDSFKIGMPTALHYNISKQLKENQYITLDWVQRLPVFENSIKRSNVVSLSYEVTKPMIAYGGSFSMYEYVSPQFGAYLRVGPAIIGSDNILPIFFDQKKLHGADIYVGLKIYPFWNSEERLRGKSDCNCSK